MYTGPACQGKRPSIELDASGVMSGESLAGRTKSISSRAMSGACGGIGVTRLASLRAGPGSRSRRCPASRRGRRIQPGDPDHHRGRPRDSRRAPAHPVRLARARQASERRRLGGQPGRHCQGTRPGVRVRLCPHLDHPARQDRRRPHHAPQSPARFPASIVYRYTMQAINLVNIELVPPLAQPPEISIDRRYN